MSQQFDLIRFRSQLSGAHHLRTLPVNYQREHLPQLRRLSLFPEIKKNQTARRQHELNTHFHFCTVHIRQTFFLCVRRRQSWRNHHDRCRLRTRPLVPFCLSCFYLVIAKINQGPVTQYVCKCFKIKVLLQKA